MPVLHGAAAAYCRRQTVDGRQQTKKASDEMPPVGGSRWSFGW